MNRDLLIQIEDLKHRIETTDISMETRTVKEWGGADVIIKRILDADTEKWLGEPLVINFQSTVPKRRAVITNRLLKNSS